MRKEFLAEVRADVSHLEWLRHKIDSCHEIAAAALKRAELADAEDDGIKMFYIFKVATCVRQARRECGNFDAHFRKKRGAKEEGEA
jgi:hypothetical protein